MALIEHLEKLRYFVGLSQFPSIKSGAEAMGISQPGLSKSLSNLEEALDAQLFNRTNEGLILTQEGNEVLKGAEEILKKANAIESKLKALRAAPAPTKFSIGMYDSIAVYLFPDLNNYLKEIYPEVEVELIVESSSHLKQLIHHQHLDLAIGVNFLYQPIQSAEHFTLFEDYYSFFKSSSMEDLPIKTPLIYHPEALDQQGKSIEAHLKKVTKNRRVHRVYNIESIKLLILKGVGVGVLPINVANPLVHNNSLKQVRLSGVPRQFGKHSIGLLSSNKFLNNNLDFVRDICRLARVWSTVPSQ